MTLTDRERERYGLAADKTLAGYMTKEMNQMIDEHFRQLRIDYLRREQPKLYQELKDDGVLHAHLTHLKRRALLYFEELMQAGVCREKAEEKVYQDLISINKT
ncbi:MAG: hypothetical protein C0623_01445 [Desulfuromonas sp.]|nr:MAG: hypothetical protein C0623_01445 [Desulfuromonas sp.]